jgi:plastocyanin
MTKKQLCPWFVILLMLIGSLDAVSAGGPGASNSSGAKSVSTASVVGRVRFEGQRPEPTRINMSADPSCAKQHPGPIFSEDFSVAEDGALGNAVVFISDGLTGVSFDPPAEPVVFQQKGCMYKPHVLAMRANQKLKVVNSDNTMHNIHPVPAYNLEWNKAEPAGASLEETFAREEIAIPIKCNVHPWMRSYIAVFKHPFFKVTEKDGSFDLHDLPPGEYTIKAWHEKLGTVTQKVSVGAGEAKHIDLLFKSGAKTGPN